MSVQAVAFDLDDTLLRDDRTVSARTVKALRALAEKGVLILPASGRARRSMEAYVQTLECASAFIACNGAEVWDPRGECLLHEALSHEDTLKVIRFLEQYGVYFHTYWEDGFY